MEVLAFCKLQKKDDLIVVVNQKQLSLILSLKGKIVQLIENYLKVKIKVLTWKEINKKNAVIIEAVRGLKKDSGSLTNYSKFDHKPYGTE